MLNSENESLWKEVSELRAKHAQQQQVIRKVRRVQLVPCSALACLCATVLWTFSCCFLLCEVELIFKSFDPTRSSAVLFSVYAIMDLVYK